MPTNTRSPSPVKVQVRGSRHLSHSTPWLHQGSDRALQIPASSGQHRSPVFGLIAGPCPCAYEQGHEESQGTDHAVWYDPFRTQSPAATREEKRLSPWRAPRNNHTPDRAVFSNWDQPNMFRITLPGPGGSRESSGHYGQAHRSTPRNDVHLPGNQRTLLLQRTCPTSHHALFLTAAGKRRFSQQTSLTLHKELFVSPRT